MGVSRGINGVPAVVVEGKGLISGGQPAGVFEEVLRGMAGEGRKLVFLNRALWHNYIKLKLGNHVCWLTLMDGGIHSHLTTWCLTAASEMG